MLYRCSEKGTYEGRYEKMLGLEMLDSPLAQGRLILLWLHHIAGNQFQCIKSDVQGYLMVKENEN